MQNQGSDWGNEVDQTADINEDENVTDDVSPENDLFETEEELAERIEQQLADERAAILESELEQDEHPFNEADEGEPSERVRLKRELNAEALARLEDAARTEKDFQNVIDWWDRLDANRERRERYHEVGRSGDDSPLEYGAAEDGLFFPEGLGRNLAKQVRDGNFFDVIYHCPFELHELVTEEYLSWVLLELTDEQKELLFLWAVRMCNTKQIGAIRGQTDRNIRKVRNTLLKKLEKQIFSVLLKREADHIPLILEEKGLLAEMKKAALDDGKSS